MEVRCDRPIAGTTKPVELVDHGLVVRRGRMLRHHGPALAAAVAAVGPGLMVMLADTDAGSIVTAAQSGARWGYQMILLQILLIPVLYLVQEVAVRLGIATRKGHGELIRERFGYGWAFLSVSTLFLAALGALVTEFAGISAVGQLFGVPPWLGVSSATLLLIAIGLTGSYQRFERVGIAVGLFELLFLPAALMAHSSTEAVLAGVQSIPLADPDYLFLLAANVGAVIMPWMVFYQQNAVIDKKLTLKQLKSARLDTLAGSIVTQLVMIAVIAATAATIGRTNPARPLNDIQQIAIALEPFLGWGGARVAFGLGIVGASFVAALVVSAAASGAMSEAFGLPHSLDSQLREAPWFYLAYTVALVGGAALVLSGLPLVTLTIDVEVMNAVLLPVVLGFLLVLEARVLPDGLRMKGVHRYAVWSLSGVVMLFGLLVTAHILVPGL